MRKLFKPVFEFSAFLFPIILVLYLVLFLLENVFTGFVSNNFDLNYFLIPVILLGFLAAFAGNRQEEEQDKPATRWDFILIAFLTILSFVVLVYKTGDLGWTGFFISLASSFLIALISLIIIFPDIEKPEPRTESEVNKKYNYRKFLISPVGLSLTGLVILIIAGGLIYDLYWGKNHKPSLVSSQKSVVRIEQPKVEIPDEKLLEETLIFVQNGSGKTGKAASTAAFLRDFNFGNVKTGDALDSDYTNAYVKFNPEDLEVASYVTFLLIDNDKYKTVNMLPPTSASQSGIILIIGQ